MQQHVDRIIRPSYINTAADADTVLDDDEKLGAVDAAMIAVGDDGAAGPTPDASVSTPARHRRIDATAAASSKAIADNIIN